MNTRPTSTAATFLRYLVLQLPGFVVAAGVLTWLVRAGHLTAPIGYILLALWVLGEIAMFPVMRVAYEPGTAHTGIEAMVGALGSAETALDPDGFVRVGAERWRAVAQGGRIAAGSAVRVDHVRALTLVVEPWQDATAQTRAVSDPPVG